MLTGRARRKNCGLAAVIFPESKVRGANMGPIWGLQDPSGPHIGPMNLAISVLEEDNTNFLFFPFTELFWDIYQYAYLKAMFDQQYHIACEDQTNSQM